MDKSFWELTPKEAITKINAMADKSRTLKSRPVRWGLVPNVRLSPAQVYGAVPASYVEGSNVLVDGVIAVADKCRNAHFSIPSRAALAFFEHSTNTPKKG